MKERTKKVPVAVASTSDSKEPEYRLLTMESTGKESQPKDNQTILPDSIQRKVVAKIKKKRQKKSWLRKMYRKFVKRKNDDSESISSDVTTIWDYAGQLDYYITHRFFLTNRVSYCVAFNACDNLDEPATSRACANLDEPANPRDLTTSLLGMTNLEMNMFWIRSIYEHTVKQHGPGSPIEIDGKIIESPPICLVATHMDTFRKNSKSKNWIKEVEDKFRKMFENMEGMPYADHVDREMYMVDNTVKSHEGIKQLRRNVGRYMKAMVRSIPLKWGDLQEQLQGIGKTTLCITFTETSKIGTQCGISKDGLSTAIAYLNDIGVIMYSSTNKKLRNTVITNLYMMLEIVTKVITVKRPVIKVKELRNLWKKLNKEGILEEKLLRHLWKRELEEDPNRFDIFTEVMKTFGLLYEKLEHESEDNRMFLVPCRMKIKDESLKVEMDKKQKVSLYLTPTDFLPDSVYNTLVVAFLNLVELKGRGRDPVVFQNRSDFDFGDHEVRLGPVEIDHQNENKYALKLEISRRTKVDENNTEEIFELKPSLCIEILSYLQLQLKTVLKTNEGIGYNLRVLCIACYPEHIHLHDLEECLKEDNSTVPCGEKSMKTDRLKRLFLEGRSSVEPSPIYTGSSEEFEKIVVNISSWYDEHGSIDKLKVLCKDLITPYNDLQDADCIRFFNLLKRSGHLTSTNVKVIVDAINVTGTNGVLEVNKLLKEKFDKTNQFITSFSTYRQHLIQFGDALSKENTRDLIRLKSVLKKQSNNQWTVILDLEQRGILKEDNLQSFIAFLNQNNMTVPAKKLEYNA
ncbi:uncharacterized protein [Antedon mediterranea]|uniref:uncharacterized protein n=1 Tax=Antedon mediterranea TaxID=105859 RepID=UPI003AF6EC8B